MIGNDIVDLNLAKTQSNWQRKGFLERQFTKKEQEFILSSNDSFSLVWLFWSMKEAAYKCYTQEHQKRFFSPKKFSCKKLSETKGTVQIENKKYYINYLISKNYISSFANKKNDFKMVSNIFFNEKKEELTKIIDNKIRALFPFEIQVKKNEIGIPFLYKNEEKLPFSVSKSHHGNYAGFAISESL